MVHVEIQELKVDETSILRSVVDDQQQEISNLKAEVKNLNDALQQKSTILQQTGSNLEAVTTKVTQLQTINTTMQTIRTELDTLKATVNQNQTSINSLPQQYVSNATLNGVNVRMTTLDTSMQSLTQKQQEITGLKQDLQNLGILLARGKPWTLSITNPFTGLANTYASLVDSDHATTGAGADTGGNLLASFGTPVLVSGVSVSPLTPHGVALINGKILQYSYDNFNWSTAITFQNINATPTKVALPNPMMAKYWRVNGPFVTATLIFE